MRTETIGDATLYLGDCREVMDQTGVDTVVSDPPYGMKYNTTSDRFSGGRVNNHRAPTPKTRRSERSGIIGDGVEFDPSPFLDYKNVVLWGCNHYGSRLPIGTTLVWVKKFDDAFGAFLSDAEVAWMKGGHGVYLRRDTSLLGLTRDRLHPTQKPVGIMKWCISKCSKSGGVFDPYMGSGSTGIACVELGREFVGVEIHEPYFEIACRRIEAAVAQGKLFQ